MRMMTAYLVARLARGRRGKGRPAFRRGARAARMEAAAGRRRERVGDVARNAAQRRVLRRKARKQHARVGVSRTTEEGADLSGLRLLAGIHHGDAIADLPGG